MHVAISWHHAGMRVALISDVHGNATALRCALDDLSGQDVDVVVCLGDLAANGPSPGLCVELISKLGCAVVLGNTDADMLEVPSWWRDPASVGAPATAERIVTISAWCADQLNSQHQGFLAGLPDTVELDLGSRHRVLAFHGSPRSPTDSVTASTTEDQLAQMIGGTSHEVLAGGHTHVPLVRRDRHQTIVNPGSIGLPFAEYGYAGDVQILDHAAYGIIDTSSGLLSIELRQVAIDRSALTDEVRDSDMPYGEWWLGMRSDQHS